MRSAFIPKVTIKDSASQMLTAHAFSLEYGFDFLAGVPRIILIHNVAERGEIIIASDAVHTIVNSD